MRHRLPSARRLHSVRQSAPLQLPHIYKFHANYVLMAFLNTFKLRLEAATKVIDDQFAKKIRRYDRVDAHRRNLELE